MRRLVMFNFMTLNGFIEGAQRDISWNKNGDPEKEAYAMEGMGGGGMLLFGRITYEMMASYWPSPMALEQNRAMAEGMNRADKVVFSKTLKKVDWSNTRLIRGDLIQEVKNMKQSSGPSMCVLGSGSIVTQLADQGLIDTYQFMINPVAIGDGTPAFKGLKRQLNLRLISSRVFKSGVVVLNYEPAEA